mmetsp:Transcript_34564/g.90172  ORF Transcript_34564/g.90172 Transcript_34564/m.90172 type:complete len:222 (-) Transcript_34564:128-793(-)
MQEKPVGSHEGNLIHGIHAAACIHPPGPQRLCGDVQAPHYCALPAADHLRLRLRGWISNQHPPRHNQVRKPYRGHAAVGPGDHHGGAPPGLPGGDHRRPLGGPDPIPSCQHAHRQSFRKSGEECRTGRWQLGKIQGRPLTRHHVLLHGPELPVGKRIKLSEASRALDSISPGLPPQLESRDPIHGRGHPGGPQRPTERARGGKASGLSSCWLEIILMHEDP